MHTLERISTANGDTIMRVFVANESLWSIRIYLHKIKPCYISFDIINVSMLEVIAVLYDKDSGIRLVAISDKCVI